MILEKIYNGEYFPAEKALGKRKQESILCSKYNELEDELRTKLPTEMKLKFEEYVNTSVKYYEECGREDFIEGFRLGIRLMLEAMGKEMKTD